MYKAAAAALAQGKISGLLVLSNMELPRGPFIHPSVEGGTRKKLTREEKEESGFARGEETVKRATWLSSGVSEEYK